MKALKTFPGQQSDQVRIKMRPSFKSPAEVHVLTSKSDLEKVIHSLCLDYNFMARCLLLDKCLAVFTVMTVALVRSHPRGGCISDSWH